jgi:hypothetical protein
MHEECYNSIGRPKGRISMCGYAQNNEYPDRSDEDWDARVERRRDQDEVPGPSKGLSPAEKYRLFDRSAPK